MKLFAIVLITLWVVFIIFPAMIAYLIGWLFIFIWINMLTFFKAKKNKSWEDYVKFGNYKIYK